MRGSLIQVPRATDRTGITAWTSTVMARGAMETAVMLVVTAAAMVAVVMAGAAATDTRTSLA